MKKIKVKNSKDGKAKASPALEKEISEEISIATPINEQDEIDRNMEAELILPVDE